MHLVHIFFLGRTLKVPLLLMWEEALYYSFRASVDENAPNVCFPSTLIISLKLSSDEEETIYSGLLLVVLSPTRSLIDS